MEIKSAKKVKFQTLQSGNGPVVLQRQWSPNANSWQRHPWPAPRSPAHGAVWNWETAMAFEKGFVSW